MLRDFKNKDALERAERFLRACIHRDLAHSFDTLHGKWVKPYPEVTGYLLSYFSNYHPDDLKSWEIVANQLVSLQSEYGGFPSFYNSEFLYTFDTGQIMHGLLSLYLEVGNQEYLDSARQAGDFLLSMQLSDGSMFPVFNTKDRTRVVHQAQADGANWGSTFSYIQVKNAEGLQLLFKITGEQKYQKAALLLAEMPKKYVDYRYTHPLGYYLEGLWSLGKKSEVKRILKNKVIPRIKANGFISYFPKAPYSYSSGSAQLAILLAKCGYASRATIILSWIKKVQAQHVSGGIFQYAAASGKPDVSIHQEINSWGTKYFAELLRLVG
jgi:hypothetical protein